MLPAKIAFVDIETTGAYMQRDRIIEIGIVVIENNTIVKTYETLVNPQTYVSPFITNMTGIREEDLFEAPSFERICNEIADLLQDCVFVAHNVRFDLGFLRNEFGRHDIQFSPKHFCTVRLSRMLFPEHRHHNLDSLIQRFNFACKNRHRAYDDAHVLYQFYTKIQDMFPQKTLEEKIAIALKKPSLPTALSHLSVDSLPQSPGVYLFYDDKDALLYVGKSTNIRSRVLSHFSSDYRSQKEMQLAQQVARIETQTTNGELGALLKESTLVKTLKPMYNRKLRQKKMLTILRRTTTKEGYTTVTLEQTRELQSDMITEIVGIFSSKKRAKDFLFELAKKHRLCHKLLGLESTTSECFAYHLGICKGACTNKELTTPYNMRAILAFATKALIQWPFPGVVAIRESGEDTTDTFLVDKWSVISDGEYSFDLDTYQILTKYVADKKNWKNIHQIKGANEESEAYFRYE